MAPAIITISKPPYSRSASRASSGAAVRRAACSRMPLLPRQTCVVEPGTSADQGVESRTGELVSHQRGRGRVADAHLAEGRRVRRHGYAQGLAGAQSRFALLRGHGRLHREVARARRDPPRHQARRLNGVAGDAGIHHLQLHAVGPGEHVGGGGAGKKVGHHLPGHGLGVGRDGLGRNAVVTGEEGQAAASQFGREGILNAGDLGGDGLHHTQGTRRLGLGVDGASNRLIKRAGDGRDMEHASPSG